MDSDPETNSSELIATFKRPEELEEKAVWVVDLVSHRIVRRRVPLGPAAQPAAGGR